jgi:hypothetical protein
VSQPANPSVGSLDSVHATGLPAAIDGSTVTGNAAPASHAGSTTTLSIVPSSLSA